ncbi:MAG: restriction endonuclease subunit S [Methylophaga sp.]
MQLKEIATINAGYPFRGKIPEVAGSTVVVVQMKDVSRSKGIGWSNCLETELTGKREPDYLSTGDILVAARGSHHYAVQVDQALASTGKQAVAAPHFFLVRLKQESLRTKDILPEFIVWLLNQAPAQLYFEQTAEGSLTKSIRRTVLEEVPIVLPPLAEQRSITKLAATLLKEQQLAEQLLHNSKKIMTAVAKDLYSTSSKTNSKKPAQA